MNSDVAPQGGTPGYSYVDAMGRRVDVAARSEGQQLDSRTLDQLRVERDVSVSAGLPTRYNQQTIVGQISGAGNRHVITKRSDPVGGSNAPGQVFEPGGGSLTVQTGPFSGGYLGVVDNVTTITLDERYFLIQDNGGGEVLVSLNTTECP